MGLLSKSVVWPTSSSRQHRRCHERAPGADVPSPAPGQGSRRMFGFGSADRRSGRLWRLLIGLQVSLLVFSLVAPIGTIAAEIQTDLFVYNNGDTVTVSGVDF